MEIQIDKYMTSPKNTHNNNNKNNERENKEQFAFIMNLEFSPSVWPDRLWFLRATYQFNGPISQ